MRLDELNLTVLNLENENSELKSMLEMAQYTSKSKNRMSISMSRAGFNQPINLYGYILQICFC
jgi:cell shape-determining protein MreC